VREFSSARALDAGSRRPSLTDFAKRSFEFE
jgi:hypothetical protein